MSGRSSTTPPMQPSDLDELRADLDRFVEQGTTHLAPRTTEVDPRVYVDPAILASEMDGVFARAPLVGCIASEIPTAGSMVSRTIGGRPVLLVRQADGSVRCFLNVCRHRAATVVTEEVSCSRRLVCPYHGWTYRIDGSHAGHPNRAAFDGHEPRGLIEIGCVEVAGLVFVLAGGRCPVDPGAELGALAAELTSMAVDRFVVERSITKSVAANWKLVVEGFLELYHVRHLHPTTLAPHQPGDVATFHPLGRSARVVAPRNAYTTGDADPARFLDTTLFVYLLFPNAILSWLTDHYELWQFEPDRVDPGLTRARWTMLVPSLEPEAAAALADANQRIVERTVFEEDWPAAESIQRNAAVLGPDELLVIGRNEPAVQHLHAGLRDAFDDHVDAAPAAPAASPT